MFEKEKELIVLSFFDLFPSGEHSKKRASCFGGNESNQWIEVKSPVIPPLVQLTSDNPEIKAYNAVARALFNATDERVEIDVPEKYADKMVQQLRLMHYSVKRVEGGKLSIGGWKVVETDGDDSDG